MVFFHLIVYIVTRYMYVYNAVGRDFALSASFVLQCFDGSEVTTREDNELNCTEGKLCCGGNKRG